MILRNENTHWSVISMQTQPEPGDLPVLAQLAELATATSPSSTPAFSPLYQQIKALILASLRSGEWKPGEAIPSEIELAARFRVSQGTVRKAVDELAAENLLLRRQGKGTFVATHSEQQVQFRFLKLVPDGGPRGSEGPAQRAIVEFRRTKASADVAKALALRSGDTVLQVRRVLSFGGAPVILEDIWLPAAAFKELTAERLANFNGPTYALFETEFNVRMVRAEEKIRAIAANETHADLLQVATGTPLLSVERIAYTYQSEPMELRRGYYRTDTHHYQNDMN
jgi:GntR family transcriptional regulator